MGLLCLLAVLVSLFRAGFEPEQVLFSNDGPLGALVSQAETAHQTFTGVWKPFNWLGNQEPSALPNLTQAIFLAIGPALFKEQGPVFFAKFYTPAALLILGLSAWFLFYHLGFNQAVCVLGALAASLNTDPFSYACWGLASITLAMAAIFLALGLLVADRTSTWIKLVIGGSAIGLTIMEGFDVGAIFSFYVAAFVLFQAQTEEGDSSRKLVKGIVQVAVVAVVAAFVAAQALSTLIGTQIKGITGTQQDAQTKAQRWDGATQWSLPKIETLRVIIPGLFGYRLDTSNGGNYWGSVGQDPAIPAIQQALASPKEEVRAQAAA
ncbi:MAG: hypothetical protein HYZ36_03505, partial [Pedosphaera parvula]|nr:hypothetical protein [Pedosphaera parvula]